TSWLCCSRGMEQKPSLPSPGTPAYYSRMARVTLVVAPFGAAFTYLLAKLQRGDDVTSLSLGAMVLVLALAAAALLHFRGSKAGSDAGWIMLLLRLFVRR